MIDRLLQLKNVGKFRDWRPVGDLAFRALTLIYGGNGSGKTTLSAVLRSLRCGDPNPIEERASLGSTDGPSVEILVGDCNYRFQQGRWSETYSHFEIFDSLFVNANVYAGEHVGYEQRKSLYEIILGEEGVRLAAQVTRIDETLRPTNKRIKEARNEIEALVGGKLDADDFVALPAVEDIDEKIAAKEAELAARRRAKEVADRANLSEISLPDLPSGLSDLLSATLEEVATDAETRVKAHLAAHMDDRGEEWVGQGLRYSEAETCPFCGQPIAGIALVEAYRAYFNEEYAKLKNRIRDATASVQRAFGEEALLGLQQRIATHLADLEFWQGFAEVQPEPIELEPIRNAWVSARNEALSALGRKAAAPLEVVLLSDAAREAIDEYGRVADRLERFNLSLVEPRAAIQTVKEHSALGSPDDTERELLKLKLTHLRYREDVAKLCDEHSEIVAKTQRLEQQKEVARQAVENYSDRVFPEYQWAINRYLNDFGAGFQIVKVSRSFAGGRQPSATYAVELRGFEVPLGDASTPVGTPSFRTVLSSGDKSTLALAFFLARLDRDDRLGNKVVILDDPISSFDRSRIEQTQQVIERLSHRAKQVVVMSHEPYFLRRLWQEVPAGRLKPLKIERHEDSSAIVEWDVERDTRSRYHQQYFMMLEYFQGLPDRPDALSVAKCIRPVVEGCLRYRFPEHFTGHDRFQNMLDKIREADSDSPLVILKPNLEQLESINTYSRRFHHDDDAPFTPAEIDDGELRTWVERTLRVVVWGERVE